MWDLRHNCVGGRCNVKNTERFANGRLKQKECFDSNPATFHLALGNLVGRQRVTFIVDKTFDHEVWNQPIHSYRSLYFNPLNPQITSRNWRDVAIEYGPEFKRIDRFQNPTTRGRYSKRFWSSRTLPGKE